MTLYDLLNKINLDSEIQILDNDGYLLQEGKRGPTMWEDDLIDKEVYMIIPGIVTKIVLER